MRLVWPAQSFFLREKITGWLGFPLTWIHYDFLVRSSLDRNRMPASNALLARRIPGLVYGMLTYSLCLPAFSQEEAAEPATSMTPPPSVVQEKVREWVRVKKQISAEQADWEAEKLSLADLNALRQKEIANLDELVTAAGSRLEAAEKQRAELLAEEEDLRGRRQVLEDAIERNETVLRALIPRFPPPLRAEVDESLARLEAADPEATLQDRFRDLLVVLGEAEQFDDTITIDAELREIGGENVEVDVLYLGLARAWYVDRNGRHAGTGVPTDAGWEWTENPSVAAAVRDAIAVRRKETAPAIVPLPFPAEK